jgi:hypothetical protein
MTPITRDFHSNTQAGFSPSVTSRIKNGESHSVWDLLVRPIPFVAFGPIFLALKSLTYAASWEPHWEVARTVAFSHGEGTRRRRGVRISLREARDLALQVMVEAERQIREEKAREVSFLRGPVDEGSSTHDL